MKNLYLIIFFSYSLSWSQKWPTDEYASKHNYLETIGDTIGTNQKLTNFKFAMYPNGADGINSLILENIRYPYTEDVPKNNGRVLLKYIVDENGRIDEIEVIESAGKPFDNEAIRILKKMKRWIPGKHYDKNVRVSYKQPFRFASR
jgi:TonB family protein